MEVLWKQDSTVQCCFVKGSDPDFEKGQNMNKKNVKDSSFANLKTPSNNITVALSIKIILIFFVLNSNLLVYFYVTVEILVDCLLTRHPPWPLPHLPLQPTTTNP